MKKLKKSMSQAEILARGIGGYIHTDPISYSLHGDVLVAVHPDEVRVVERETKSVDRETISADRGTIVAPSETRALAPHLEPLAEGVRELIADAKATATRRAYAADWRVFEAWAWGEKRPTLPLQVDVVTDYLKWLYDEGAKVKTISRALAGLIFTHRSAGHSWATPEVIREEMNGIRKNRAKMGERLTQKAAMTREVLAACVDALPDTLVGCRDRAILTLMWTACARRSEIAGLDVDDVTFEPDGMIVRPRKTKTDQAGKDTAKGIPLAQDRKLCATRNLLEWLDRAGIASGPVFRPISRAGVVRRERHGSCPPRLTDRSMAQIIKNACKRAGFDPKLFSGHSPRAGFITSAARAGVEENAIAAQSGHKSVAVLRGYIRHANLFIKNPAKGLV